MGQLSKTTFTDNHVATHDDLNDLQDAIATAHNTHATGDFPDNSVPVTAFVNDNATFIIALTYAAVLGHYVSYTDQKDEGVAWLTEACTLVSVTAVAASVTVACPMKLYYNGLPASNLLSLSANYTGLKDSAPVVTSFAAGGLLEMRFDTGPVGDGSGITMLLECKKKHVI